MKSDPGPKSTKLLETFLSIIKRTKKEKRKALGYRTAIEIAKVKDPSLYAKYKRYRNLYLSTKRLIEKKYGQKGIIFAKKKIR